MSDGSCRQGFGNARFQRRPRVDHAATPPRRRAKGILKGCAALRGLHSPCTALEAPHTSCPPATSGQPHRPMRQRTAVVRRLCLPVLPAGWKGCTACPALDVRLGASQPRFTHNTLLTCSTLGILPCHGCSCSHTAATLGKTSRSDICAAALRRPTAQLCVPPCSLLSPPACSR